MRTIVIGCDNAAVHLEDELMNFTEKKGYTVENIGCDGTKDSTCHPYVAEKVCQEVISSGYQEHDVLVCDTESDMAMTVNKFKGIHTGVCHDISSAGHLKLSNDGSVICMGERVIGTKLAKRILKKWLGLDFTDCASTSKVEVIKGIEGESLKWRRWLDERTKPVVS